MSLRVRKAPTYPPESTAASPVPDGYATRVAKLVPAEALGLYAAGQAIVPEGQTEGLWLLAAACILLTAVVRTYATREPGKGPQRGAVAISVISLVIYLAALKPPAGPLDLPEQYRYLPGLLGLIWGAIIPHAYKGD